MWDTEINLNKMEIQINGIYEFQCDATLYVNGELQEPVEVGYPRYVLKLNEGDIVEML